MTDREWLTEALTRNARRMREGEERNRNAYSPGSSWYARCIAMAETYRQAAEVFERALEVVHAE